MIFDLRLVAYAPNGARLGVLNNALTYKASLPHNDVSALDMSHTRGIQGAQWLETFCEVALEWNTGEEWSEAHNGRFLRMAWDGDHLDVTQTLKLAMPGYSWLLSTAKVFAGGTMNADGQRQFTNATPGRIMRTLINEAKGRGALAGMAMDISDASDSDGKSWATEMTIAYNVGDSLDMVLNSMAEQGVIDWNFWGRELHMYNPGTILDRDLTTGPNPVQLRSGDDMTQAPDKGDASGLIHRALVLGDEGLRVELTNPSAVDPWGSFEVAIQQSGVTDAGTATLLGQQALKSGEREKIEMTRALLFAGRRIPLRDYAVGDTVYAPGKDGVKSAVRILQLTLEKSTEDVVSGNLTLNDRFIERSLRAARRARALSGGVIVGGGSGGKPAPEGQDKRTPAAPQGLVMGSSGYIDSNGMPRGLVEATWAPVSTATDGTAMDIQRYELWGRLNVLGADWRLMAGTTGTYVADSPYDPGHEWAFRVRAIGLYATTPGAWSSQVVLNIETDTEPPPQPSAPVLSARLGTVRVEWDGKTFEGEGMPSDLDRVEVHASLAETFTPTPATLVDTFVGDVSQTVLTDLPYNDDVWALFIAVDRAGNRSDPSTKSSTVVTPLVDTDLIGEIINGANIIDGTLVASDKIVGNSITGALIQALAIEAGHIKANAITADKIAAGAITAEKISLGSVAPGSLAGVGLNRVTDPGFEDTNYWAAVEAGETAVDAPAFPANWRLSGISTNAHTGSRLMIADLTITDTLAFFLTPEIPAPSSRRVYASLWARVAGGATSGTRQNVYVRVRRADGSTTFASVATTTSANTLWHFVEGSITLPSDAVSYAAYLRVAGHTAVGQAWFDDVCVQDAIGSDDSNRVQIDPSGLKMYVGSTERVRLDVNGFSAWNNSGQKTVEVESATGRATITGSFYSGFSEPYVRIAESGLDNPQVSFHPAGSSAWSRPGNVLSWTNGDGAAAIHVNAPARTASSPGMQMTLADDGNWALGVLTDLTSNLTRVRGGNDGTFWLGPERTTARPALSGGPSGWWFGEVRSNTSAAVSGGDDGTWRLGSNVSFVSSTGSDSVYVESTVANVVLNGASIFANGNFQGSNKNFRIPHPKKAGMDLLHGCTESHVNGIEYWGTATLDENGLAQVEMPEYFEALAKAENRAVILTPIGAPYAAGADEVQDGHFTVHGEPSRKVAWLVKAERGGYDFDVEQPTPDEVREARERRSAIDDNNPQED